MAVKGIRGVKPKRHKKEFTAAVEKALKSNPKLRVCPECGEYFTERTVTQKYCSRACGSAYRRKHKFAQRFPPIKFECAQCGCSVETDGLRDMRTRFCCEQCEKKYWRHPPWERRSSNKNYRSVEEYASWERRTND